jgi:hypothetical protein
LKELLTNPTLLAFIQRAMVIGVVGVILFRDAQNTTAWAMFGAVVTDLFHAAKANGNGKTG